MKLDKLLHIAILVRRLNVRGGTQRMVAELARKLKEEGYTVTLYTLFYDPKECYPEILHDFSVVSADLCDVERICSTSSHRGPIAFIRTYISENRAVRNLALKISPDTDILNPHDPVVYRTVRYYKKIRNIPAVWMLNDMCTKKASLRRAEQFDVSVRPSFLRRVWYKVFDTFEYYWFIRCIDIIAFLDERDKKWADEEFTESINVVVRNGLNIKEFPYIQRGKMINKNIKLLAIAILLPHRRFEDVVESVGLLRARGYDVELSIAGGIGDRVYYEKLQMLISERNLGSSVNFLGQLGRDGVLAAFHDADIFVFPCHLQSWGLIVFEAMASGLPVVVSETAGASEVLTDNKNALIIPPFSPEKITEEIIYLYEHPMIYKKLSKQGREFVEKNVSWDNYSCSMLKLFYQALHTVRKL